MAEALPRESLHLRVAPELKRRVEEYSQGMGVSINSGATFLLMAGVRAERAAWSTTPTEESQ